MWPHAPSAIVVVVPFMIIFHTSNTIFIAPLHSVPKYGQQKTAQNMTAIRGNIVDADTLVAESSEDLHPQCTKGQFWKYVKYYVILLVNTWNTGGATCNDMPSCLWYPVAYTEERCYLGVALEHMSQISPELNLNLSTLVQVMDCCHQAAIHYLNQCLVNLLSYPVTFYLYQH